MIVGVASRLAHGAVVRASCAAACCAAATAACGAADRGVPAYPHPDAAPVQVVAFPPPPAQIEHLDDQPPAAGCLWADGQWVWATQHWNWRAGGWVRPPEGCRYSAPSVAWGLSGKTGVLYYRPGRWYSAEDFQPCPDPVSCPAPSPVPSSAEASLAP